MIKLSASALKVIADLNERRLHILHSLQRLDGIRPKVERVAIHFYTNGRSSAFADTARAGTKLHERLHAAMIEHFKADLADVDAELSSLGVAIEEEQGFTP